VPDDWQAKPAKLRQKDRDARWTVKTTKARSREGESPMVDLAIPEFGYQNHVSADRRHRLIRRWLVTDAAAHAGTHLADLLDPGNIASAVWADSGYRSRKNEDLLRQRMLVSQVHRKKPARRPMPARIARANARKSAAGARLTAPRRPQLDSPYHRDRRPPTIPSSKPDLNLPENPVNGGLHLARIGLRIDVDQENLLAFAGQAGCQRDARRGFASTAFLAGDRNDHNSSTHPKAPQGFP
jgi:hypothetical protein